MRIKKSFFMLCMLIAMTVAIPLVEANINGISTVEAAPNIKISKKKATLYVGQTLTLKVKGTNKKVKWSSSKKSVATVSSKGKVKAKKKGTATITAKVGNKKYNCKVTVKAGLLVDKTNISIDDTSSTNVKITFKQGDTVQYNIADSNIVSCKWSNQWDGNNCFLTISGEKAGSTIVNINNKSTKETIKIYVVVTHKSIPVSSIILSKTSLSMNVGDKDTLNATINPTNADNKTIAWSSSNTNVATINNGVINAVGIGNANITATVGNISATCNVIVTNAVNIKVITQFPKEFCYVFSYNNNIYSKISITEFQTKITKESNKYYISIIYSGEKTYDNKGKNGTTNCSVGYKLYDSEGYVVKSGVLTKSKLLVGDKFKDELLNIGSIPAGDYTLELIDYYI